MERSGTRESGSLKSFHSKAVRKTGGGMEKAREVPPVGTRGQSVLMPGQLQDGTFHSYWPGPQAIPLGSAT